MNTNRANQWFAAFGRGMFAWGIGYGLSELTRQAWLGILVSSLVVGVLAGFGIGERQDRTAT